MICEPSSCTAARPSRTGSSWPGSPSGRYTAYGEYVPCSPPVLSASSSAEISPGRATRCTTGRAESASSASASSSRLSPSASAKDRAIHSGWAWVNASAPNSLSGARVRSHSSAGVRPIERSTPLAKPFAFSCPAAATSRTEVSTAAWSPTRVYSSWYEPRRSAASTSGAIRSSSRDEFFAITASSTPRLRNVP